MARYSLLTESGRLRELARQEVFPWDTTGQSACPQNTGAVTVGIVGTDILALEPDILRFLSSSAH